MKYIPAEKLIAEIERRIEETKSIKPYFDQFWAGQISALKGAIKIAESLQQEQPFPRWIHANYSDKPEIRRAPSGKPYLQSGSYMIWLSDLETLPKDGTDLTNPIQEQLEVDLENEIDEKWDEFVSSEGEREDFTKIARHFAEWGAKHLKR